MIKKNMAYLWAHESMRVFHDKLVSIDEQKIVLEEVKKLLLAYLNEKLDNVGDLFFTDFFQR